MTKRLPFRPLMQNAPGCPVCYQTVSFDGDGWACRTCHVTWSSEDRDQCPAEIAPYLDHHREHVRGYRYRCVRDADHPLGPMEHHIGARSDGGVDYDGYPFRWDAGEYPQWQPENVEGTS